MKTRSLLFLFCFQMIAVISFAQGQKVKGNGVAIVKNVSIPDYDQFSFAGSGDVEYVQSDAAPFLEITIDENLYPFLEIKTEGKHLRIGPKQEEGRGNKSSYQLQPTLYKIKTNSRDLAKINLATSGSFTVVGPLHITNLEINQAGSGKVILNNQLEGKLLKCNQAGSGGVTISNLYVDKLECNQVGSGGVQLGGEARQASYNLASSGSIKAYDCKVGAADANVAGSGGIDLYVTESLKANVVGSGGICYKGNPDVKQSVMGSGKVVNKN